MIRDIKIAFFLAFKSIRRGNKGTLAMTILIMTLAFVNLVFISSIFLGIIHAMNVQSINNILGNIVIEPREDKNYIEQVSYIKNLIKDVPGVIGVSAHYMSNSIISYDAKKDGKNVESGSWALKSINIADEIKATDIHKSMVAGEYLNKLDRDKIIIGKDVSGGYGTAFENNSLGGVKIGDEVKVRFSNGLERKYEVKGIFSTKSNQVDQIAFVTEKEIESVLGVTNRASEIIVKISDTGRELEYIKEFRRIGIMGEDMKTWEELMGFSESVSKSFGMISIILGVIGTIVAGVTIFIVIFVSVVNKKRQIGILKAIGMKEATIVFSFVIQALFYAVAGIGIGFLIMNYVVTPFFISHPLDFPVGWVSLNITKTNLAISVVSLMMAALIGGFIPAWRGAKESILEAIWG
jgi:putative ABC transport system permease protein